MNTSTPRWRDGVLLSQVLALLLLALSYLRFSVNLGGRVFNDQVFDALFAGPIWGTKLGYNLVYFALAALLIHCVFGAMCWLLGQLSARAWPSEKTTLRHHILLWFIALTVGLLANNAAVFFKSSLGEPYAAVMNLHILGLRLGQAIWFAVLAAAAVTVVMAGVRWWRAGGRVQRRGYAALATAAVVYTGISAHSLLPASAPEPSTKPNVILIGLDSLRADLLEKGAPPGAIPHIEAFMKAGTRFSNAMTPLARTFPSMCSMLTGRHPHHTGAVMNLLSRELVDDRESLPRILASAGYHTAYATDEVRFSNIDSSFGFAQAISPPIGVSDFMISQLADTPLINLLMNTRLASWLFPNVYANRGAANTYDPDTFVSRLDRELTVRQPLFLTVHLTLAHWPYRWLGAPFDPRDKETKAEQPRWPAYYMQPANRVDRQFADVLAMLEEKKLLENAIVVVYSDHGESFGYPHEALVPDDDALVQSMHLKPQWGHGTSVLTTHQYRIVLGMRRYGGHWQSGREIAVPVSFEDVAPTLVETLAAQTSAQFDGRSLLALLEGREGAENSFAGRIRFTETEFNPPDVITIEEKVSPSKLAAALSVYRIDRATDRIQVKPGRLKELLANRQYAAVGDEHMIAAFPKSGGGFDYLTVALAGGAPRPLYAEPPVDEPELHALWTALQAEFGYLLQRQFERQPVAVSGVANQ